MTKFVKVTKILSDIVLSDTLYIVKHYYYWRLFCGLKRNFSWHFKWSF